MFNVVNHKCHFQRSSLLQSLAQVQAKPEVMSELTSIASLQTKGLKRHFQEEGSTSLSNIKIENLNRNSNISLNCVSGSKKRKALLKAGLWKEDDEKEERQDLNIVGFEVIIVIYSAFYPCELNDFKFIKLPICLYCRSQVKILVKKRKKPMKRMMRRHSKVKIQGRKLKKRMKIWPLLIMNYLMLLRLKKT